MVEQVEYLGQQTCSDQNYPLIRVTFRGPTAKEVAASVFASLLRTTSQTLNPPSPSPTQLRMLPLRPHDFWDTEFAGGGVFAPPADPHGPPASIDPTWRRVGCGVRQVQESNAAVPSRTPDILPEVSRNLPLKLNILPGSQARLGNPLSSEAPLRKPHIIRINPLVS